MGTTTPWSGSLREEFQLTKFGLGHAQPDLFIGSQWKTPKWFYLTWRLFWFLWHVGWIIANGICTRLNKARDDADGAKWFIYLSNLTLLVTTATATLDLAIVLYSTVGCRDPMLVKSDKSHQEEQGQQQPVDKDGQLPEEIVFQGQFTLIEGLKQYTIPWHIKCLWLFYNTISSVNIIITIMYWTVEHKDNTDVTSIEAHSINTVFIVTNTLVTSMPVQIVHFIYPMVYIAVYFLFNFIYTISGGTDLKSRHVIYSMLTWDRPFPTSAVVILAILVVVPLVHLLVFALYTFRLFIYSKIYFTDNSNCVSYTIRQNNRISDIITTSERMDSSEITASVGD